VVLRIALERWWTAAVPAALVAGGTCLMLTGLFGASAPRGIFGALHHLEVAPFVARRALQFGPVEHSMWGDGPLRPSLRLRRYQETRGDARAAAGVGALHDCAVRRDRTSPG
jgi:hypothetical protein